MAKVDDYVAVIREQIGTEKESVNFKPIMDRILCQRLDERKDSLIVEADAYATKSNKYQVIALGDFVVVGGQRIALSDFVSVGDIVLAGEYNVEEIELDGEKFQLVRIQDVRGVRHGD